MIIIVFLFGVDFFFFFFIINDFCCVILTQNGQNNGVCVCSQANDAGDFFPIWGTCMGMQLLTVLVAGKNLLSNATVANLALPLELTAG